MSEMPATCSVSGENDEEPAKLLRLSEEREEMPDRARRSAERYRRLVELSPHGISVHCAGRLEFVNPAAAKILGAQSCEELLGREILEFVHCDYHQVFSERLVLLEQDRVEIPWMVEKFLRCDGGEVQVEVTALPLSWEGRPAFQTVFRDITDRKAGELRLERMANYDVLTALPNRGLFLDRLGQLILHARRDAARFALLFIELDRFKEADDRLGHYFGDLLLKKVAQRLTMCLKETDTVARLAGGEFVVILSRITARADAARVAERVLKAIARPYSLQGRECTLGASIGISLFPEDGETGELQLMKADTARYRSKKFGPDTYQFYTPEHAAGQGSPRLTLSAQRAAGRCDSDENENPVPARVSG